MGLVMPRIDGTLLGIQGTLNEASFNALKTAVNDLATEKIIHLDFAARNIFYKKDGAQINLLLGDFGNTIKYVGDDFDAKIQAYVERYNFRGRILACTKIDGVHPVSILFVVLYDAFLSGKDEYEALLKRIRDNDLFSKGYSIALETWAVRRLTAIAAEEATQEFATAVDAFIGALEKQINSILPIFAGPGRTYDTAATSIAAIKSTLQRNLARSDKCLLDLMMLSYLPSTRTPAAVNALTDAWFPRPAGAGKGGRRGGGFKEAESLKSLLEEEDPVLEAKSLPMEAALNMLGGRRVQKTRRKRHMRVKMSRRM